MTLEEFVTRFNIKLNEQQWAAVKSVSNPTLLLAVPGSGKTTVLVTRLGYMIYCCGIAPEKILTVTYTVAATRDMKARFASIFGDELADRLEFRTINGICAKIISYYGSCVGKSAFELVTDEGFKTKLLSEIYLAVTREYATESDLKNLSTWITYIKNMQLTNNDIKKLADEIELPIDEVYTEYCKRMRAQSLMDYDDQMVYALTMLKKSTEVLAHFQDMYQYICVDEAQDTSKIQHAIIELLANKYENLFMVGDEDQSIYGFRAAFPEALLDFEKNHPYANVLLMEENFRSNAKIVEAADRFIQKNEFRHKKNMKATREHGAEIKIVDVKSRKAQYSYLRKVAEDCTTETAVLYRDNESILPVVDLLERDGIPYKIKNADLTFFSHRVVLDIVNIISFAMNQYDTELFMQIYYKIGTYMNKATALEACRYSEKERVSVLEAALRFCKMPAGTQKSVKSMQTHLQGLLREPADKAIYRIQKFMGYDDFLERAHVDAGKLVIISAIAENEPSAIRLVQRLQELSQIIKEKMTHVSSNFILSTIHSSKGLEYDTVYLLDAKDGVFPENVITNRKYASDEELKLYEEERRLFYVGVTRAKNTLVIFNFKDGATFTKELMGNDFVIKQSSLSPSAPKKPGVSLKQKKPAKRIVTETEYQDKLEDILSTGYIKHKTYGDGMLLSVNGDNLEIDFNGQIKKCKLLFMMENRIIE